MSRAYSIYSTNTKLHQRSREMHVYTKKKKNYQREATNWRSKIMDESRCITNRLSLCLRPNCQLPNSWKDLGQEHLCTWTLFLLTQVDIQVLCFFSKSTKHVPLLDLWTNKGSNKDVKQTLRCTRITMSVGMRMNKTVSKIRITTYLSLCSHSRLWYKALRMVFYQCPILD